jgi:hypothetical protein
MSCRYWHKLRAKPAQANATVHRALMSDANWRERSRSARLTLSAAWNGPAESGSVPAGRIPTTSNYCRCFFQCRDTPEMLPGIMFGTVLRLRAGRILMVDPAGIG